MFMKDCKCEQRQGIETAKRETTYDSPRKWFRETYPKDAFFKRHLEKVLFGAIDEAYLSLKESVLWHKGKLKRNPILQKYLTELKIKIESYI